MDALGSKLPSTCYVMEVYRLGMVLEIELSTYLAKYQMPTIKIVLYLVEVVLQFLTLLQSALCVDLRVGNSS